MLRNKDNIVSTSQGRHMTNNDSIMTHATVVKVLSRQQIVTACTNWSTVTLVPKQNSTWQCTIDSS